MPSSPFRLPWFVGAPAVSAGIAAVAIAVQSLVGPYFERIYLNEADPLTSVATTSVTDPAGTVRPEVVVAAAATLAQGSLRDGEPGHNGRGTAKIIRDASGALTLRFENFSVTNGPDIYVILATGEEPSRTAASGGLNLGKVRATDGNVNYQLPAGTDPSVYRHVIIWCKTYDVVFASARLEKSTS